MAELRERLEALEHRMERAEAALRYRIPAGPRLHTVPVRFEDVALRFSRQEWESLDEGQQELYRNVMEGNYEMLVSLYCALFKPELLLWPEREELSALTESEPEAADVSPEPAVEPPCLSCTSCDGLLETKTTEPGEGSCREPGKSGNPAEERNLVEQSRNLVEQSGSPAEARRSPAEGSRSPAEGSRSPAAPENCSTYAKVEIPMEVAQEEVAAEKLTVPETSSEGVEEEKGLEQENGKDSGNVGQGPVVDIPEEPGKVDPGPGEAENGSCVGRLVACHRNATREFYPCPICRKNFLLKINLLIHQRSHENLVPYVCVHCDRKFMSKRKIKRHLRAWAANGTCQPSEPEVCPVQTPCPTSQPQTRAASRTDCGTVWEKPSPARCPLSPGKAMYTCNECLENFSSQSFLTLHQRWHSRHHLIFCPCCSRRFSCISDFVRQHWAHVGVRPHQCGICQKTFKRSSHLKEHRRIHMWQKRPFPSANPMPGPAAPV
ncbi:ZN777 protein, partial [Grallaria varia]|nr:ZN777 protein [Grallaria varia]